ncbi:unnamed protein product [Linum trigynum]|uniref:Aminotransferase-like plant mobile domain-containing protein n=1 Tax=Linum trigynum TaxID=586398 RepID=A0AAV2F6Z5_9ROSI
MMHNVDFPLLKAFVERWQPDTNTFHMLFGEMTITLHDVAFLLKIRVDGELLAAPARGDPLFVSGIVDLLGISDKNEVALPSRGLRWYEGGGMLVDEAMARAWIYEYFPSLRINRRAPEPMTEGGPFARRWEGSIRGGDLQRRLDHYRRLLDGFTAAHVDWLPFGANPGRAEPRSLYRGVIRVYEVAETYDPSRVLHQFGYRQVIPDLVILPCDVIRHVVGTYKVIFGAGIDQLWETRGQLINLDAFSTPFDETGDVDPLYLKWYTERTHLHFVPSRYGEQQESAPLTYEILACQIIDGIDLLLRAPDEDLDKLVPYGDLVRRVCDKYVDIRQHRPYRPFA